MAKEGIKQLGTAIAGGIIGGPIGFLAGAVLGSYLFPAKNQQGDMPPMASYPVQRSNKGTPRPIVYGTDRIAGNIIWMGELQSYTIEHSAGGGKGGGGGSKTEETRYRRSFLLSICEGIKNISRCWQGKTEIDIDLFTQFSGEDNQGIAVLIGESLAADYKTDCCAFFNNWELGTGQAIPNFVFEVTTSPAPRGVIVAAATNASRLDTDYEIVADVGTSVTFGCDRHSESGRYLITQDADAIGQPIKVFDQDDNDLGIDFDNTGSGGWAFHDVILAARFTKDGQYIIAGEKRLLGQDVLWKWNSYTGELVWRLVSTVIDGGQFWSVWSIEVDSDNNIYVFDWNQAAPFYNRLDQFDEDGNYITHFGDVGASPAMPYDFWLDETIEKSAGITGKWMFTCGKDIRVVPNTHIARIDLLDNLATPNTQVLDGTAGSAIVHDQKVYAQTSTSLYKLGDDLTIEVTVVLDRLMHIFLAPNNLIGVTRMADAGGTPEVRLYTADLVLVNTYSPRNPTFPGEIWTNLNWPEAAYLYDAGEVGGDANPADIIEDLLTNTKYGAGIDTSFIDTDSFAAIHLYCAQNDLLISLKIDTQKPVLDWIDYVNSHFRGYLFMSGGKIHLGAFKSDSSVFAITQTDLVIEQGENPPPPVNIKKRFYNETINRMEIVWENRSADYDGATAIAQEEVDQRVSGKTRKRIMQLTGIKREVLANKMRWFFLFDSMYRYTVYSFTLAYKNMLLEVGDVGTLSDGQLISSQAIRILSIEEDKNGRGLLIEAVEDVASLYSTVTGITLQETERTADDAVVLTDSSISFREDLISPFLHLSIVPTNDKVNGWYIYRSYDDVSYALVGRSTIDAVTSGSANSTGTLQNNLIAYPAAAHRSLDNIIVDIGTITDLDTSITDAEFFNRQTYLKIGDEIIGYKTCVETAVEGVWEITGLIRGMFNTEPVAHILGETVSTMRIDFTYILDESELGQTIYFKATPFYADQVQSLSDALSNSYAVQGYIHAPLPISLMRIHDRDMKTTYKTDDVIIDFEFCSRTDGYNRGGFGNILWDAFTPDGIASLAKVTLKEIDETEISETIIDISEIGLPMAVLIEDADRDGNNPYIVELLLSATYDGVGSRKIQIEKI